MSRTELSERNRIAWEADAYRAWVARYGRPAGAAATIAADPGHAARRLLPHIGEPAGASIANPLGSHGRIGVALALLGADVTVFDLSAENARYARETATEAGVDIDYVVGDFPSSVTGHAGRFDVVAMELGIVHYFADIGAFVAAVRTLARVGGRVVLNEFHPLAKKALRIGAGEPRVRGDYFRAGIERAETPYRVHLDADVPDCAIRRWTLGEIVSAFASGRFRIERLLEHPSADDARLPGTFTLVAVAD